MDQHIVDILKPRFSFQSDDEFILDCNECIFNELIKTQRFCGNEYMFKNRIATHHPSLVTIKPKKMLWSTFYLHIQNIISSLAPFPRAYIFDDRIRKELRRGGVIKK